MTILTGNLQSVSGTPFGGPGCNVVIYSRLTRPGFAVDGVVLELQDRIPMPTAAGGRFQTEDLDPGPIRVELEGGTVHGKGWDIDLPEEGVWALTDLVDAQVDWSPSVIGRAEAAAKESREHADRAEASADRVGTAEQVGTRASEAGASASAAASARSGAVTARNDAQSARDAAEGHANRAAASESNSKASETNAGDYAAIATTAATEAVDAMDAAARSAAAFSIYTGTGSPEGKVAAPVGSIYTDTAATAGAIRWIKTSGTGNTGWTVEYGDTGWRTVTSWGSDGSLVGTLPNGMLAQEDKNGGIYYRRFNGTVTLSIVSAVAVSGNLEIPIPTGFSPGRTPYPTVAISLSGSTNKAYGQVGNSYMYASVVGASVNNPVYLPSMTPSYSSDATWSTDIAWPTSLPGTPA